MNYVEAMQALSNGKKIRAKTWSPNRYWYMKNKEIFDSRKHTITDASFNTAVVYEIFDESNLTYFQDLKVGDQFVFADIPFGADNAKKQLVRLEYKDEETGRKKIQVNCVLYLTGSFKNNVINNFNHQGRPILVLRTEEEYNGN